MLQIINMDESSITLLVDADTSKAFFHCGTDKLQRLSTRQSTVESLTCGMGSALPGAAYLLVISRTPGTTGYGYGKTYLGPDPL